MFGRSLWVTFFHISQPFLPKIDWLGSAWLSDVPFSRKKMFSRGLKKSRASKIGIRILPICCTSQMPRYATGRYLSGDLAGWFRPVHVFLTLQVETESAVTSARWWRSSRCLAHTPFIVALLVLLVRTESHSSWHFFRHRRSVFPRQAQQKGFTHGIRFFFFWEWVLFCSSSSYGSLNVSFLPVSFRATSPNSLSHEVGVISNSF